MSHCRGNCVALGRRCSCPQFARHANQWRHILEKRSLVLARFSEASKDYKQFDRDIDTDAPYLNLNGLLWSIDNFSARKSEAKIAYDAARAESGRLPEFDRKMNEIALHTTAHATSCAVCQQAVSRILGQDWSPF